MAKSEKIRVNICEDKDENRRENNSENGSEIYSEVIHKNTSEDEC